MSKESNKPCDEPSEDLMFDLRFLLLACQEAPDVKDKNTKDHE